MAAHPLVTRAIDGIANKNVVYRKRVMATFVYLVLSLGAVLMLLPFVWMISASFKTLNEVLQIPPTWIPRTLTLVNYFEIFRQMPFGRFFLNSVIVALITVAFVLITSSLAGYAFAKFDFRGKSVLFLLVLCTMMVPFQVRMIPLYTMIFQWDLVNTYTGLVLPGLVEAFGIFLMRQFIASIPNDLIDAARIDGASEPAIYLRIILPLSRSALAALAIFTVIGNWESFLWPLLVTNSQEMYTLPIGLAQFSGRYLSRIELQMAASTIAILPMVLVFLLLQRHIIEGITLSGLKA
jgi:multiple sugar transport system permease protein